MFLKIFDRHYDFFSISLHYCKNIPLIKTACIIQPINIQHARTTNTCTHMRQSHTHTNKHTRIQYNTVQFTLFVTNIETLSTPAPIVWFCNTWYRYNNV